MDALEADEGQKEVQVRKRRSPESRPKRPAGPSLTPGGWPDTRGLAIGAAIILLVAAWFGTTPLALLSSRAETIRADNSHNKAHIKCS